MATVYEARHARLQANVAVKICNVRGPGAEQAHLALVREAHLCARLDDAHFPRVYDTALLEDGTPYFVMEEVLGPTLEQHLERGPLSVHSAVRITFELLAAAAVAHSRGVAHRDLKPGNILLQVSQRRVRRIRIIDFGVAHLYAPSPEDHDLARMDLGTSNLYGTPGYMAPEQARGRAVDGRTDLYAIGVTLYEMLTGGPAFDWLPEDEGDTDRFLRRVASSPLPDLREQVTGCPPALTDWLACATALAPGDRFDDARQASRAILGACAGAPRRSAPPTESVPSDTSPAARRGSTRRRGLLAMLALGGVAVMGATLLGAWTLDPSSSLDPPDGIHRAGEEPSRAIALDPVRAPFSQHTAWRETRSTAAPRSPAPALDGGETSRPDDLGAHDDGCSAKSPCEDDAPNAYDDRVGEAAERRPRGDADANGSQPADPERERRSTDLARQLVQEAVEKLDAELGTWRESIPQAHAARDEFGIRSGESERGREPGTIPPNPY